MLAWAADAGIMQGLPFGHGVAPSRSGVDQHDVEGGRLAPLMEPMPRGWMSAPAVSPPFGHIDSRHGATVDMVKDRAPCESAAMQGRCGFLLFFSRR
jgi:hypothetical protein